MSNNGEIRSNAYDNRHLYFNWWVDRQSIENNQTKIGWQLRGDGGNSNWYMSGNFKVVIDGSTVYQSATRIKLHKGTTVASGYYDLNHNTDGSRQFSASIEAGIYYFAVNVNGSGSWTLPMIARATQPTINRSSVSFGESVVIHCPRASHQFTHTIQASVDGKLNWTTIASNVATIYSWSVPKNWGRYLTHTTDKLRLRVLTYSGHLHIGTKDVTTLLSVTPTTDMIPVVDVTLSDANNFYNTYGGFVKGKSKIKAKVTERLYEQAVVTSRSLVLNGITYQSNEQTSEVITSTTQRIEARVIDSRGMSGIKSVTPVVYDWYEPKITQARANRCQANGTLDESGTHIKLDYACAIAPVNNRNRKVLSYSYRQQNQSQTTTKTITMESFTKTGHVIFPASGESSWEIKVMLQDAFTTSQVTLTVGTAFVLLDFHHSGKGIGVGKVAELQHTLDIASNWQLKYKNAILQDFIVEQGISNGWTWRKWHSGIAECYKKLGVTTSVKSTWGNWYTSGALAQTNITYPFTFIEIPTVSVTLSCRGWGGVVMSPGGSYLASTTHTGYFEIARGTQADNATYYFNYYVIGKWKN